MHNSVTSLPPPVISGYTQLIRSKLNLIQIDDEPDLELVATALKSLYEPASQLTEGQLSPCLQRAITDLRDQITHPEKYADASHIEAFKHIFIDRVSSMAKWCINILTSYSVTINEALEEIPVSSESDFTKIIDALESIVDARPNPTISPELIERIEGIRHFLSEPEMYAKPAHQAQFKQIITIHIRQKITELKNSTADEKARYIALSTERKRQQEVYRANRERMRARRPPAENEEAHTISEYEMHLLWQMQFQDELSSEYEEDEDSEINGSGEDTDEVDPVNGDQNGAGQADEGDDDDEGGEIVVANPLHVEDGNGADNQEAGDNGDEEESSEGEAIVTYRIHEEEREESSTDDGSDRNSPLPLIDLTTKSQ